MVKHIVMWKLQESAEGAGREENCRKVKEILENLQGKIPGLIKIEVGIHWGGGKDPWDVVLYSELESRDSLQQYQEHPLHQEVLPFVKAVTCDRACVDFEL